MSCMKIKNYLKMFIFKSLTSCNTYKCHNYNYLHNFNVTYIGKNRYNYTIHNLKFVLY